MKKIVFLAIILLTLLGAGFLAVKGGSKNIKNTQHSVSDEKVEPNTVVIKDYKFSPSPIKVKKGTKVTWENRDIAKHNVAIDDKDLGGPNGPLIGQNQKYTYIFTNRGTYKYHCDPHPYMKGTVEVTE